MFAFLQAEIRSNPRARKNATEPIKQSPAPVVSFALIISAGTSCACSLF